MRRQLANRSVWVLRPSGLEQGICREITQAGGKAVALPMLAITNIAVEDALFSDMDAIVFVSRNAVRAVATQAALFCVKKVYAVGDGTAAELSGLACTKLVSAGARGGAETLLAHPDLAAAKVRGQDWLIVCGTKGRSILQDSLRERGAKIKLAQAYDSEPIAYSQEQMERLWAEPPSAIAAYSAGELRQLHVATPPAKTTPLLATPIAVLSDRIAGQARELGFCGPIMVAGNTSDAGCIAAICNLL